MGGGEKGKREAGGGGGGGGMKRMRRREKRRKGGVSCGGGSHADSSCSSINTKLPAVRALNRDQTAGETEEKGSAVSFPSHRTVLLSLI